MHRRCSPQQSANLPPANTGLLEKSTESAPATVPDNFLFLPADRLPELLFVSAVLPVCRGIRTAMVLQLLWQLSPLKLPVHYKEALVLYTHRRSNPSIVYHDNVMDTDFEDFQQMDHKYANETEKQNALRDTYGNTYWYYYEYGNK